MENSREGGGRVKVVGIPGSTLKIEEKTWISRGVTVNLTGNPGGYTSRKPISSTQGDAIFSWKSPSSSFQVKPRFKSLITMVTYLQITLGFYKIILAIPVEN